MRQTSTHGGDGLGIIGEHPVLGTLQVLNFGREAVETGNNAWDLQDKVPRFVGEWNGEEPTEGEISWIPEDIGQLR